MIASLLAALLPAIGVDLAAQGDGRLAEAVMKRDGAAVRVLLGQKVDVNAPGIDQVSAEADDRQNPLGCDHVL